MLYRLRALSCTSLGLTFHHNAAREGIITGAGSKGYGFVRDKLTKKYYKFNSNKYTHNDISSNVTFMVGAVDVELVPKGTVAKIHPMTHGTPALPPSFAYGKCFLVYTQHPRQHKELGLTPIGDGWYFLTQAPPSPLPQGTIHYGKHATVCMLDSFCAEPEEHTRTLQRLNALVRHIVDADEENSYSMCDDVSYAAPRTGRCIYDVLWKVLNELNTPLQRLCQGTAGMNPLIPFFEQKYARNVRDVYHYLYDEDPVTIPLVVGFLRDEIRWRRANASNPIPRSPDSSATEQLLREYITNVIDDKERKNCAAVVDAIVDDIVSLRKSIPRRAEVLFSTTLSELLESCAYIVYPDDDDARHKQVFEILDAMKNHDGNPFGNLLKETITTTENLTTITDDTKVTFKKFITEQWPEEINIVMTCPNRDDSDTGTVELRLANKKAKMGKEVHLSFYKQRLKIMIAGENYLPKFDVTKQNMSDLRSLLMSLALPCPPKIPQQQFKNVCPFIQYTYDAVAVDGEIGPRDMQPPAKKSLTIITGASGTGKTTYAQFTLPRREWGFTDAVVLTVTLSEKDANQTVVEREEETYRENRISTLDDERLRRMFALAALRRREDSFPDEADYVSWREYCIEQIGCGDRDQAACEYVIDKLKSALKECSVNYDESWFKCTEVGENKITEPVVFIIDEIGKSLPLARAVVSAQLRIYTHPWVQSHLTTLNLVLCGTGAEMAHSGTDTGAVATDPSAFHQLEVCAPTDEFVPKALAAALLCNPKTLKDTIPLLYKQEQHMPLYAAARTNMRLLMLVCKLINMMWSEVLPSDSKEKAIKQGKDISSQGSLAEPIARADAVFAESIGLDGFVAVALLAYLQHNGLQRLGEDAKKVVDATLVAALGVRSSPSFPSSASPKCTLLPLAPLRDQDAHLDNASTLGLVVRGSGMLPSPAITAVVTFAFNKPGKESDGYALETFTARWASRLVRAQCGFTSGVRQLPFQVPWNEIPPRAEDVGELLEALRTDKVLVLLNGARAAGADVIVLQLRPNYDDVKEYMTQETYDRLWPDGVVASMTLVSDKRRKAEVQDQLAKMGVLRCDAMRELGPVFLAWLCAKANVNKSDTRDLVCDSVNHNYGNLLKQYTEKVNDLFHDKKIIVRPRLVYGADSLHDDMDKNTLEFIWEDKSMKKKDVWAVGEELPYGLCPPETFGPLSNMVWARPFKEQ